MSKLPKPHGTYFYTFPDLDVEIGVQSSRENGWTFCIKHKGKVARMSIGYDSKSKALDRARVEMIDLGWPDVVDTIEEHLSNSVYEYPTFPPIKVYPSGTKWRWRCGKYGGEQKTKKLALAEASALVKGLD